MRRLALVTGFALLPGALGVFMAVAAVDRGLAAAPRTHVLCISGSVREAIQSRTYPASRQDALITEQLNFDQGAPANMAWWHLRAAVLHFAYVNFWSSEKRSYIFNRLAAQMPSCRS